MQQVNLEEFEDWKQLVVTKLFFKWLENQAKEHRDFAAVGGCLKEGLRETGDEYIRRMISASVFEDLKDNSTYEEICEDADNPPWESPSDKEG